MSYELDDLGEGERPPVVAAVAPSSSSTGQRTCTVRRMFLVSVILAVLLVLAMIAIVVGLVYYFKAEESPSAEESPPAPTPLPSTGMGKRTYSFHTKQTSEKIGKRTYIVNTISGHIKGPAIHVRNGSILSVNVTNGIEDSKLSIHWHGLDMRGHQVFDGVVGLTQCPIAPRQSYLYEWKVNEQPGTYWYHTHDREVDYSGQDFIRGPLIIHHHDSNVTLPPESASLDSYQIGNERILFYTDLYPNYSGFELPMLQGGAGGMVWSDDSIEGNGIRSGLFIWTTGVLNGEEQHEIEVENGEYRFRIINGGGQSPYFFSIDGHTLRVVASDGYPVEPYETDVIQISNAERYDAIVTFNITTPTKNVWIRALTPSEKNYNKTWENYNKGILGILRIRKNKNVHFDKEIPPNKDHRVNMTALRILNCKYFDMPNYNCAPATDLVPTTKREQLGSHEYHTVDILEDVDGAFFVSINDHTFTQNLIPRKAVIMASTKNDLSSHTNILSLPTRKSVTIVLRSKSFANHPMHLHGHHFEVLEIAIRKTANCGKYNSCPLLDLNTAFTEPIKQLMKRPKQGVLKDTIILPPGGAVAVRINSDNPGVWFFHCHIHLHLLNGLAIFLNEEGYMHTLTQKKLPRDYPFCDYSGDMQSLRSATCSCNVTDSSSTGHKILAKCSTPSLCDVVGH